MATWFTSDTHFGDPRVLRIDRRPYRDMPAHDAALVANWNALGAAEDEVWHLGDFALSPSESRLAELLGALNGVKHLIVGNNDGPRTLAAPGWASIGQYAEIVVDAQPLVLCHYAFRTWNRMGRGVVDLHGHSHGKLKPMPRQFDVGVDAQGFAPVSLQQILASRSAKKAGAGTLEP